MIPVRKVTLDKAKAYEDEMGNRIEYEGECDVKCIVFKGLNNKLVIDKNAVLKNVELFFDCNHGLISIGSCNIKNKGIQAHMRVGENSSITIGDDCMISSSNEIKTDDSHPIFCVRTGERVNMPRSIYIGNHVWIGRRACVLGGSEIEDGSVIGMGAIVKGKVPNNSVAIGIPARVVRKDIAWERPHLSMNKPYLKPDKESIKITPQYWNLTKEEDD